MYLWFSGLFTGFFIVEILLLRGVPVGEIRMFDIITMGVCAATNLLLQYFNNKGWKNE